MSIASRITSIEEHIGNAYDSIKKFGVDTSVINKNIENIANVINDEIYDKLPKVTQSGAGFTLENVQNGQVDDFKMNGTDLEQDTTIGKNLCGIPNQTFNYNGVDVTIQDGEITLNGTCNSSTVKNIEPVVPIILNGDYTLNIIYIEGTLSGNPNFNIRKADNQEYINGIPLETQNKFKLFNFTSDTSVIYGLYAPNGTVFSNFKMKIQLISGTEADYNFEPYTNGPSPNPDYPQEIKVAEGRQVITDKGKNLFDKDNITKLNGTININSNDFEGGGLNYAVCISCKPNTTYTVTKRNDGNTNRFALASSETIPSSTISELTPVLNKIRDNDSSTLTLTTEISANYLIVQYYRSAESILTEQQILDSIQIEESSTATNYEPYYNPVSYNIDLTNDLLKYNKCDFIAESIAWYFLDGNSRAYGSNIGTKTNIKFPVEQNKVYTFRYNVFVEPLVFQLCYDNENIIATLEKSIGNNSFTFTSDRNGYVVPRVRVNASSQVKITGISVVEGEEDYYDYKLAKMPNIDYKNRIYKNNGNWYFEKNVGKVILDGSDNENWANHLKTKILSISRDHTFIIMCNYFKPTTNSSWVSNDDSYRGMCSSLNTVGQIKFMPLEDMTLNEFKTWLSTHNVEVWCQLDNPVTTQITNTTLINQLEAISVHTGTNIITISNDNNIIPEIEITRLKELEKLS